MAVFRARNEHESQVETLDITVVEPSGEPVQVCRDFPEYANCKLVALAGMCDAPYYKDFCCKTCTEHAAAAQDP